jgi:hypothetical protein
MSKPEDHDDALEMLEAFATAVGIAAAILMAVFVVMLYFF